MSSNQQCAALIAAKDKKGLSWAQVATAVGKSEQHVLDIVNAKTRPTEAEFTSIANVLGITASSVPHTGVHATV